jgi:hypothetical protein
LRSRQRVLYEFPSFLPQGEASGSGDSATTRYAMS